MADRKTYYARMTPLPPRNALKAVGIVVAGAATVMLGSLVAKSGQGESHSPGAAEFVGVRHDAAAVSPTAETRQPVTTAVADQGQESSSDTVVRNGITVVTPKLLVPVIDIDALQAAACSDEDSSSDGRKQSGDAKRSHKRHHSRMAAKRWKAYGLAVR